MEIPPDELLRQTFRPAPERVPAKESVLADPPSAAASPAAKGWNFELRVRPDGVAGFRVHLLSSPVGDEVGELRLPFPLEEVDRVMADLAGSVSGVRRHLLPEPAEPRGGRGGRSPDRWIEEIGETLFEALFPEPIRCRWRECVEEIAQRPGSSLRLILKSDPTCPATADLHRLPWELLRDPVTGAFLALSRRTQPIRQLALDEAVILDEPQPARRLLVLVVLACPPGLDSLDLVRERRKIELAVEGSPEIEARFLEDPTFAELTGTLRAECFHVLHFMGHGAFDRDADQGHLVLAGPGGTAARVPAERLAQVVRDAESLRLVVLNACETGRSSPEGGQPFAGLAHALLRSRIPAVLAMQLPMPDGAAVELSRAFYQHLAAGAAVDEALAEARVAVYASEREDGFGAWAVPVLYVRRPELAIFRPLAGTAAATGGPASRGTSRSRRWLPLVLLLVLVTAVAALFFIRAPWSGVRLEMEASRVAFTLSKSQSLVDTLDLAELAVPDLARLTHPDPATGIERVVKADDVDADLLRFRVAAPADSAGELSLDDAVLPAGTRVELARAAPGWRLSLDFAAVDGSGHGRPRVTASVGEGATLSLVRGAVENLDLGTRGRLVMVPRGTRIDLDLTPATLGGEEFHSPIEIEDLRFAHVDEHEDAARVTRVEAISTIESGRVTLTPLGGGEPTEIALDRHESLAFGGLRGQLTDLALGEEGVVVAFRGRADEVTVNEPDGRQVDLMPTWRHTPWALRLGAASSALALLLAVLGHTGVLLRWTARDRTA